MKRNNILFLLFFTVFVAVGQNQSEYINNGDEAMRNLDFNAAKIWYEEVVYAVCDLHTITQLTKIWVMNDSMRTNMGEVMLKCLSCLDDNATNYRDTASMELLIKYYSEGIGTNQNEKTAEMWKQRLEEIRNPYIVRNGQYEPKPPRDKVKMQFFAGYAANLIAPAGLTVGGVGGSVGWYLRVRSNLSFQDYTMTCDNEGNITDKTGNAFYKPLNIRKVNTLIGTGGIVIKADPSFYIAIGAGYCSHDVIYQFERIGADVAVSQGTFWAKVDEKYFNGVALDLDGTFRIGKTFYGTAGISVLNFKYVYANAGLGLFF